MYQYKSNISVQKGTTSRLATISKNSFSRQPSLGSKYQGILLPFPCQGTIKLSNRLKKTNHALAHDNRVKYKSTEVQSNWIDYKVRDKVINAIEELGLQVSASDVSLKTGLPIRQVSRALEALAYDTLASITVSPRGQLVFRYVPSLRRRLLERSIYQRIQSLFQNNASHLALAARVTFGACLMGTLVLVALCGIALAVSLSASVSSSSSSEDDDDDGKGRRRQRSRRNRSEPSYSHRWSSHRSHPYSHTIHSPFSFFDTSWFLMDMTDLLLCFHPSRRRWSDRRDYYYHAEEGIDYPLSGSNANRKEDSSKEPRFAQRDSSQNPGKGFVSGSESGSEFRSADNRQESLSLVAAIFSFVFGDGNPNDKFEETKWQAVADWIQMKNGVVTAEELAPFLTDTEPALPSPVVQQGHGDGVSSHESQDERFVIPALVRFDGRTVVDDHGNLLYVFDSVSSTTPSPAVQSAGNPSLGPSSSSASSSPSASRNRDFGHNSNPKSRVKIHYSEFSGSSYRMYNKTAIAASPSSPSTASSSPASSSSLLPALAVPQRVPLELLRRFSAASVSQCLLAGCMGLASYLGVNWLSAFLKTQPRALHVLHESGLGFVPSLLPFMRAYATFFVLMPLVRAVWIQILNVDIRRRNAAREAALASLKAAGLARGGGEGEEGHGERGEMSQNQSGRMRKRLKEKLEAARQLARVREEEERQRQREDWRACQERVVRAKEEEGEVDDGRTQEDWDRRFEEKRKRGQRPSRTERIPTPSGI